MTSRLELIKDRVVRDSYPQLVGRPIRIRTGTFQVGNAYQSSTPWGTTITVHERMLTAPTPVVEALLAHELCHVLEAREASLLVNWVRNVQYNLSARHRRLQERATDMRIVSLGYGKRLIRLNSWNRKHKVKLDNNYLTSEEIKELMQ